MSLVTSAKTDSQLKTDVESELKWEPRIDANEIGVAVKDGVVTLTGWVDSYIKRFAAEEATHGVRGVKAVANDITVRLRPESERNDADIAGAAVRAIEWDALVDIDDLDITVAKGWVTLKGTVDWAYQRDDAERMIRRLTGVNGVTNLLVTKPRLVPSDLKKKIDDALVRSAHTDAGRIMVEVQGNKVTLRGTLRSYAEKTDAYRAAAAAPGVTVVDNRLAIEM
jgi:osmotically-inducible protein OsmY